MMKNQQSYFDFLETVYAKSPAMALGIIGGNKSIKAGLATKEDFLKFGSERRSKD